MFEKQKITAILPSKSGIGKNGKPYEFYKIKTDRQGDKILTTFGSAETAKWKVGDEIEISVTTTVSPDGKYTNYNFEYPKKPSVAIDVQKIWIEIDRIKRHVGMPVEGVLTGEDAKKVQDLRNTHNEAVDEWNSATNDVAF